MNFAPWRDALTEDCMAQSAQSVLAANDVGDAEDNPKRAAILTAAARVFLAAGYGPARMDDIAAEAGVAKQTVYSHFGSKEALFEAIIEQKCAELMRPVSSADALVGAPEAVLGNIARGFLETVLQAENTALYRLLIAESTRFPALAEAFYRVGPRFAADGVATYLAACHRRGVLHVADAKASAELFFAMLRGDLYMRRLLDLVPAAASAEIDATVDRAVAAFVAAHARDAED